jgi:hypothetical protein
MKKINELFDTSWKINLALFLCSFSIYFFYFYQVFLNINSILSSITLDSLKNYYTFVYHIKNDQQALVFNGMNFPFGEHVIYTDCQPILTFILRLLPFTHNYLIGIMHSLIFLSFIISPLILYRILRLLDLDKFSSFFISLAIALLSPQFVKINGGHFALAYGCILPISILLVLMFLQKKNNRTFITLFTFNTLLFIFHPYLAFCASVFTFLSLILFEMIGFNKKETLRNLLMAVVSGVLPMLLFKLFMLLTDHHVNRTTEPYGADLMVENLDSLLAPVFGPFRSLMEHLFPNRTGHYEGHTYLGFFTIFLSLLFILLLPFTFKKLQFRKEITVIFTASFFLLFISFGIHLKIFNALGIKSATFNQFRAVCRFAWIFYYTLPLFIIPALYHSFKTQVKFPQFKIVFVAGSILFLSINLLEANYFFKVDSPAFWKFRNFFREDLLNQEEKKILGNINRSNVQAIIPLPIFHGGSEMYDRPGFNNSMIPSMIYSYHSKIPILSVLLSRTSITETEDLIQLLNSYKKQKRAAELLNKKDFFVLTTKDPLLPDETRLLGRVKQFAQNDSLTFGYISEKDLLARKLNADICSIAPGKNYLPDTNAVFFIPYENHKPFITSNINDYEKIAVLDSNKIRSGTYIVSFHYYYTKKTYRSLACNLIVTRTNKKDSEWQYNIPVRYLSGFYDGFAVFEYRINLSAENKYEFIIKGYIDQDYRISDFMLRPENKTTRSITQNKDTVYNNFPG